MIRKIAAGLFALVLASCAGDAPAGETAATVAHDPTGADYVKMSRTRCFGTCPEFDLTLYGDGRLDFDGRRYTKLEGQHMRQASSSRFMEAVAELEARGFENFDDTYTRDNCKLWVTDHPSVTVELRLGTTQKTVNWYTGCRGMPEQADLKRMVDALERIMEVEQFIGTDAERAAFKKRR